VLILFYSACTPKVDKKVKAIVNSTDIPTYEQFVDSHTFPYSTPLAKQVKLKSNYQNLSIDLSKSSVLEILGKPDHYQESYSKENNPRRYLGSSWTYCFNKQDPNIVNVKTDKEIVVFFNVDGKTHWITANIEGLPDIGSPNSNK
jgi:hypothetical protein